MLQNSKLVINQTIFLKTVLVVYFQDEHLVIVPHGAFAPPQALRMPYLSHSFLQCHQSVIVEHVLHCARDL